MARVRSLLRLKFARDALHTKRNRLALLYTISQEINSQLALDDVLSTIVTLTREALAANMCSIIMLDQEQNATRQFLSREGAPTSIAGPVQPAILEEGLGGWVLRHRQSTIVDDASHDRRWLVLPGDTEPVGSAIAAPLLLGVEVLERRFAKQFAMVIGRPKPARRQPKAEDLLARFGVRMHHTGESFDNLLKIFHLLARYPELSLFVQTNPAFSCASIVTEAMAADIEKATGVPVVSVNYDGTASSKNDVLIPYLEFLTSDGSARRRRERKE